MKTTLSVGGLQFHLHGTAAIVVIAIFGCIFAACFIDICCGCGCRCFCSCFQWPCWRCRRRRPNRRTTYITSTTAAASTTARTTNNDASGDATRTSAATVSSTTATGTATATVNPNVVAPITSFIYASTTQEDDQLKSKACGVCLIKFKDGEKVRRLALCSHGMHAGCMDDWFLSHSSCPICRSTVEFETLELIV